MSRREEKAPEHSGSVVSSATNTGKAPSGTNIVLGEPKTTGMTEATSDAQVHPTSGGETVTQAPASEQATGTGEATSSSHADSAEPSTDIYVPTAPETEESQNRAANAGKSGALISKFTEKFA